MSLQKTSSDDLLQLYAACLRNGIADREDKAYMAEDGAYILFIEPGQHRVCTFSLGLPVSTLEFQKDNKTWDSITSESSSFRNYSYHAQIGKIQLAIEIEKGERRLKTF